VRKSTAAFALVAILAACSGPTNSGEPVVLRVLLADDWASAPIVGEVIEDFERDNPQVRVRLQGAPFSQIPDEVSAGIELGQPPDVAHWHAFAAAADGLAQPLDDAWADAGLAAEDYLPGAVEDVTWDGRRHGLPLDVNALVLMANEALLAEADVTPADLATPAGFRAAASSLRTETSADRAIAVTASSWAAYGWITANGGQLIEEVREDGTPVFTFDDPATIEAVALLVDLVASGDAPPPLAPDLSLDAIASFTTGQTAMHVSGSWDLPTTRRAAQASVAVADVAILPLPQRDPDAPRTVLGGSSLFVPVDAEHPELAFEFMLALTADEVAVRLAAEEGRLPARERVYDDPLFTSSPDLAAFVAQLPSAEVMPLIAYPEVAAAFRDGLESALAQRRSPDEAMAEVQAFAERWVDQR
jgi:multiple sugar transport system substrate-binding protein